MQAGLPTPVRSRGIPLVTCPCRRNTPTSDNHVSGTMHARDLQDDKGNILEHFRHVHRYNELE